MSAGKRSGALFVTLILAVVPAGCLRRAQARTAPPPPPLEVPLPPPRVIEPASVEVPQQPVGLIDEPPTVAPLRPRPPAPRADTAKPEPPKAEVPADASKPEEPRTPSTVLQTAPTQRETEEEARIRTLLDRAAGSLNRIDYRNLGANARMQYDTAKGFIKQAEDAIKTKNLLFASSLADKAAALAA